MNKMKQFCGKIQGLCCQMRVEGYGPQNLADLHRFLLAWKIRHGNPQAGDTLSKDDIMQASDINSATWSSSKILAQGFANEDNSNFEITRAGAEFVGLSSFDLEEYSTDGVLTLNYSRANYELNNEQRGIILRTLLKHDPTTSIWLRNVVICMMRMINLNRGEWIPDNTGFCGDGSRGGPHRSGESEETYLECPDCYPSLTQERKDLFFDVFLTGAATREEQKLGTIEKLAGPGKNFCEELGLITTDDTGDNYYNARFTEQGFRVYQLLEMCETSQSLPDFILNPLLGNTAYDEEVNTVTSIFP